jgi:drug/metabolite transporter (DMT)-like permease
LKFGIVYILLAWLAFTIMATVTRYTIHTVHLSIVLFFQNFISFVLMCPWIWRHGWKTLKTDRLGLIFVRSIGGLAAFGFLFMAVQKTTLVDAVLLNNTGPLLLPLGAWLWMKVPIEHKLWPGIIAGFLGIILILKPGLEIFNPGALYGLGAAVCMCIVMLSVRSLAKTDRHHTILFYYFLIASLICLPWVLWNWKALNSVEWIELLAIGLLSFSGQWAFMRAFHHARPVQLGPFCYMAVVFSGLIEWILWNHIPDLLAIGGILLVCAGGIWTIRYSKLVANS